MFKNIIYTSSKELIDEIVRQYNENGAGEDMLVNPANLIELLGELGVEFDIAEDETILGWR